MEASWKEVDFHKTEYSLDSPNPDLTYEIFEEFVKEWYHDPDPIIYKDKKAIEISFPSKSFLQWAKEWAELNFPKSEPEVKQAMIRNLILSFIRFEVKSWHPLRLEGIHYWLYKKSQIAMEEFIKNVKEKFYGQVDILTVEEKPVLPETPSNNPHYRIAPNRKGHRDKWVTVWKYIELKRFRKMGMPLDSMREAMEKDKVFYHGPVFKVETMKKIIRAGEEGELIET